MRKKAWFEKSAGSLDPGLIFQLREHRKKGKGAWDEAIPVILRFQWKVGDKKREDALNLYRKRSCDSIDGRNPPVERLLRQAPSGYDTRFGGS